MAYDDCLTSLLKEFGDTFSKKQIEEVLNDFKEAQEGRGGGIQARLNDIMENRRLQMAKYAQRISMDIEKNQKNWISINQEALLKDPIKALEQLPLGGTNFITEGGNRGIDVMKNSYKKVFEQYLTNIQNKGLWEKMIDPSMKKDIYREKLELEKGDSVTPNRLKDGEYGPQPERGNPGVTGNSSALEIASELHKLTANIRAANEAAGYPIGNIEGYFHQVNTPERILGDAKNQVEREANIQKFKDESLKRIDFKKMFPDVPPEMLADKAKRFVDKMTDKIIDRTWGKEGNPDGTSDKFVTTYDRGVGSKLAGSRSVIYLTPEDAAHMDDKFGDGSLLAKTEKMIDRESQRIANLDKFGSTPLDSYDGLISKVRNSLKDNPEMQSKIDVERPRLLADAKMAMGLQDRLADNHMTKFENWSKWRQNLSKMWGVTFKKPSEWMFASGLVSSQEGSGIRGFGANAVKMGYNWFKLVGDSESRSEIFQKLGLNMQGDMASQAHLEPYGMGYNGTKFTGVDSIDKAMMAASNFQQKASFIRPFTNRSKAVTGAALSEMHANNANLRFDKLNPTIQANMGRWGIGPAEWELIRNAKDKVAGRDLINSMAIGQTDRNFAKQVIADHGLEKVTPEKLTIDAQNKYINMLQEMSERAVFHSNLVTQSAMKNPFGIRAFGSQQLNQNSAMAHVLSLSNQYRSVLNMMGQNISMITQSAPGIEPGVNMSRASAIGKASLNYIAPMVLGSTILAAMSDRVKREITGKEPANYSDPKYWLEMAAQGGLGPYGEVVFGARGLTSGKGNMETLSKVALGPTLGEAYDFGKSVYQAAHGDWKSQGDTLVKMLEDTTPGQTIPGLRRGMDWAIFNSMHSDSWVMRGQEKEIRDKLKASR